MKQMLPSILSSIIILSRFASAEKAFIQDSAYENGEYGPGPTQSFQAVDYKPVQWNYVLPTDNSTELKVSTGLIFSAPRGADVAQPGGVISNLDGTMVYSAAEYGQTMTFMKVQYNETDHILLWTGQFLSAGYGYGRNLLLNQKYEVVANFTTDLDGVLADFHDTFITAEGTAIMTAYATVPRDLTPYNGPNPGFIVGGVFQEIEIETGHVLFMWNSLDHVDPTEGYADPGPTGGSTESPWDYFHINSVEKDSAGNYLISARHTHAVYYIDGQSGEIIWRLNGKKSDFTMTTGTPFTWQHDARWQGENVISLFDNAASTWQEDGETARGIVLSIDTESKTATLIEELFPFNRMPSPSQGNMQVMENGNMMVGWGKNPYFSEYDADGNILYSVHFGIGDVQAYRAYRFDWTARPSTRPTIGLKAENSVVDVYASWNGATEVVIWELFASTAEAPTEMVSLTTVPKTDFETTIPYTGEVDYAYFQIAPKNADGQYLAYSDLLGLDGTRIVGPASQVVDAPPLNA
ncbi:hypothetical protein VNI00_011017 [Paramarasmius palmivorus]|uniref:ASST-domain-containing protein n=1 Tax=Paramarasmius palmivorus TaxID=297713 RepID=A0AAW0CER2_9AGAR